MKLNYYNDTDSLFIDLSEKKSVDTTEIALGVNLQPPSYDLFQKIGLTIVFCIS